MSTSMREALEEAIEFADQDAMALTAAGEAMIQRWRAALSSPSPDRLSEEERDIIACAKQNSDVGRDDRIADLLAIIDRLSRQPSRTEELTANISEQARRVGATFEPSAEKIATYEAAQAARQPEAEPVAWAKELADNWRGRRDTLTGDSVRDSCADELEKVAARYTSPRLDREKVADTWECAGRKQAYPEPGECDWPGCGCDPNATKVIESFLEQNWKPPLDRKAITAALKPFAAISVYEDDDSAPVKVIVNYRISYDFTLGDFRALQSADAIMRETR